MLWAQLMVLLYLLSPVSAVFCPLAQGQSWVDTVVQQKPPPWADGFQIMVLGPFVSWVAEVTWCELPWVYHGGRENPCDFALVVYSCLWHTGQLAFTKKGIASTSTFCLFQFMYNINHRLIYNGFIPNTSDLDLVRIQLIVRNVTFFLFDWKLAFCY